MNAASGTVIELYLSKGCCRGEQYAQANDSRLFTLSDPSRRSKICEHVLRDEHSIPVLHSIRKGKVCKKRVEVYKGDAGNDSSLVCTLKKKSAFSASNFNVFLAGSSFDGPPDYKLRSSFFGYSIKIFQQDRVVAKAKSGGGLWCGCCGPDYTVTTFAGVDQALIVLLFAIYEDLRPKGNSDGDGDVGGGGDGGGGGGGCGGGCGG